MKTKIALLALALGASTCFVTAQDGPPPGDNPQPPPGQGGLGRQRGGPGGPGGFHLLPPRAQEQLNLTDDQKAQLTALEADTRAKLEKILTPEQLKQLKNMRPPMRQGSGQWRGGPGGPPSGNGNNPPAGPPPGEQ